jgi:hypothetical protein
MDPEVAKYFRKIISSFGMGLLWMFSIITAGFYFRLAMINKSFQWYNGLFYAFCAVSFLLLIRYYYRMWSAGAGVSSEAGTPV